MAGNWEAVDESVRVGSAMRGTVEREEEGGVVEDSASLDVVMS